MDKSNDIKHLLKNDPEICNAVKEKLNPSGETKTQEPKKQPKTFESVSAKALQDMNLPPVKYIVDDLLSVGLHLLAAPPKYGKSWMMIDWGLRIPEGKNIWGHKVLMGDVLYLALEDNLNRLQDRMNKILRGQAAPDNFRYVLKADNLDFGLMEQLETHMNQFPGTVLIVIDTFQKIRNIHGGKENQYAADYSDAGRLKAFADKYSIAVLLIHHLRKMADDSDPFNMISGSVGISGSCDSMFVLKKDKRSDSESILYGTGRDIEPLEMIIAFDKQTYTWNLINSNAFTYKKEQTFYKDATVTFLQDFITPESPRWEGTAQELWEELMNSNLQGDILNFPLKSNALSKRINELNLKRINITKKSGYRGKSKIIILEYISTEPMVSTEQQQTSMFEGLQHIDGASTVIRNIDGSLENTM